MDSSQLAAAVVETTEKEQREAAARHAYMNQKMVPMASALDKPNATQRVYEDDLVTDPKWLESLDNGAPAPPADDDQLLTLEEGTGPQAAQTADIPTAQGRTEEVITDTEANEERNARNKLILFTGGMVLLGYATYSLAHRFDPNSGSCPNLFCLLPNNTLTWGYCSQGIRPSGFSDDDPKNPLDATCKDETSMANFVAAMIKHGINATVSAVAEACDCDRTDTSPIII